MSCITVGSLLAVVLVVKVLIASKLLMSLSSQLLLCISLQIPCLPWVRFDSLHQDTDGCQFYVLRHRIHTCFSLPVLPLMPSSSFQIRGHHQHSRFYNHLIPHTLFLLGPLAAQASGRRLLWACSVVEIFAGAVVSPRKAARLSSVKIG